MESKIMEGKCVLYVEVTLGTTDIALLGTIDGGIVEKLDGFSEGNNEGTKED